VPDPEPKIRLDKWLWQARFVKSRSLASKLVKGGHVRVNGVKVSKASTPITPEDVLTFPQARDVRVVQLLAIGKRRGPAPEAQTLYLDLTPVKETPVEAGHNVANNDRKGRPTKRDRRLLDRWRGFD